MTTTPTTDVRREAEAHLRALVGSDDAVLRDDQWTAIEALAVDRRRALVVQRTGWGKSAVYFVATLLLRAAGRRADRDRLPLLALMRNQIAAAERAGIRAVTINSTNIEDWEPSRTRSRPARSTSCWSARSGSTTRASATRCCRDWPRPAGCWWSTRRTASPTGATTSVPTTDGSGPCWTNCPRASRCWRRPRPPTPGSPTTSPSSSGTRRPGAARSLDRESLRLGVVRLKTAQQRLAWLADHLADQPGSGIVYCLTVAATQESPTTCAPVGTRSPPTPDRPSHRAPGPRAGPPGQPGQGPGRDQCTRHGLRRDARVRGQLGAPPSPVAYYQQVGRAGRGVDRASDVVLLPAIEDRDIWAYFASLAFPARRWSGRPSRCSPRTAARWAWPPWSRGSSSTGAGSR